MTYSRSRPAQGLLRWNALGLATRAHGGDGFVVERLVCKCFRKGCSITQWWPSCLPPCLWGTGAKDTVTDASNTSAYHQRRGDEQQDASCGASKSPGSARRRRPTCPQRLCLVSRPSMFLRDTRFHLAVACSEHSHMCMSPAYPG
jgi:hypothetical protein